MRLTIISGGQTGVDQAALEIAKAYGFPTGGTAPYGYRTDEGPNFTLRDVYGLKESPFLGYRIRTVQNVRDSDLTLWYGVDSPGYRCTDRACHQLGRPLLGELGVSELLAVLRAEWGRSLVVNVAGNRLRTHPKSTERARLILTGVFQALRGEAR